MKSLVGPIVKLVAFAVVTIVAMSLLASVIGSSGARGGARFTAIFTDAALLNPGDDVRIAGVRVGQVTDVAITDHRLAKVEFAVTDRDWLPASTIASLRYRNLVGQRYLALDQGEGRQGQRLASGATLPLEQTRPAVDLTTLFNGFRPLFATLSPDDVNTLARQLISVFQGEGGTVAELVRNTASLTSSLAEKDAVIGAVITNLNDVLAVVDERDDQLGDLIVNTQQLVSGLAADKDTVGRAVTSLAGLTTATADILGPTTGAVTESIGSLKVLADTLNRNRDKVDATLKTFPVKLEKLSREASYGSWFQFYLCGIDVLAGPGESVTLNLPTGLPTINQPVYTNSSKRCTQQGMRELQAGAR